MSSFFYGRSTKERLTAPTTEGVAPAAGTASISSSRVADVISAVVPAEALVVYSTIVVPNVTMSSTKGSQVTISDPGVFKFAIIGLCVLSAILYVFGRIGTTFNPWDVPRALIPAAAFLCWSALQTPSGLHLFLASVSPTGLIVIGALVGVAVAGAAAALGYKTDIAS